MANTDISIFNKRIGIAGIVIFVAFLIIVFNNYNLQIIQYEKYKEKAFGNSLKLAPIVPSRGKIFDRNGILLADNALAYKLVLIPENTKDILHTLQVLKAQHHITDTEIAAFHKRKKHYKKFQQIPLKSFLNEDEVARFLTRNNEAGVELVPYFYRIYPNGIASSHVVGYVSKMSVKDKREYNEENYNGTDFVGKIGIEKQYERKLHGKVGVKQIERNSAGRVISEHIVKNSIAGEDIYLTIDDNLQQLALQLLKGKRGSIVLTDVHTGEVLTMVSSPSFDNNLFTRGISNKNYQLLSSNKNLPLFNRSIKGAYPPGSTIKPMVALGSLEVGTITKHTKIDCKGYYKLPNYSRKFHNWKRSGQGVLDVTDSIAQSCDIFFYDLAYREGIDTLSKNLSYFGIGTKTGIDLPGEESGVLPTKEWKKIYKKEPWYTGETLITGIGQGFMTATPLQLSIATAIVANFGKKIIPTLVKTNNNKEFSQIPIKNIKNWELVIEGMKKTIYDPKGTARRLNKKLKYTLAGKTGTAQVFGLDPEEKYIAEKYAEHLRDHALFVGFAPIENPKVAISVIVENAGSGSVAAAPIARKILDRYFKDYE
jgi:penicillin-binding protein 2